MTRVLVTGATGYIGGRLVPELLEAGHEVRCLARTPSKLHDLPWADAVEVVQGDVGDRASLDAAMRDVQVAYFLVHSMGASADFAASDRQAAEHFRDAAVAADVNQIVYLGGLGVEDDPDLSPHLRSRHEVGRVLADGPVPVTELRAAIIIGSGSASFEMLRNLVEVLPAMVTPRWVDTRCQPIAIRDVLAYLVGVVGHADADGVLEVGGPDVLTYREVMQLYADVAGLPKRFIVPVPVLTPRLSSHWVGLVTPIPSGLARPLIDSLINEVVVHDHRIDQVAPRTCLTLRTALELALRRVEHLDVTTRWSSADLPGRTPADPFPSDPDWAGGSLLVDEQEATSAARPEQLFETVAGIGGDRGWYVHDWLWELRGLLDRVVGGIGLRRGRRHPDDLRPGDALDFWRVETYEPPHLLRLRAEMRLPGDAWLEWQVEAVEGPDGRPASRLRQRALYHPRGLWGRLYWYCLLPFHALIFKRMATVLAETAEHVEPGPQSEPDAARG